MKIAVCVKEVLDARVPLQVWGSDAEIRPPGAEPIRLMNPADRAGLEVALDARTRDRGPCRVEAFSVCLAGQEGALYHAIARGVDRAERLEPLVDPPPPVGTALALARRFSDGGFDIICCGDETLDNSSAVVGPLIAELLGWNQVTSVCAVREHSADRWVVVRKLEKGYREVVEARFPLVVTLVSEAARPRYVSWRLLERARKNHLPVVAGSSANPPGQLPRWPGGERKIPPRARIKKRFAPDPNLSAADRVRVIMAGGPASQQAGVSPSLVEGDVEYLVEQLYRFLKHHEFV
jgi:electron transfer flavoprotein beta subunit